MKAINPIVILCIPVLFAVSSCMEYRYMVENDPLNPSKAIEEVQNEVKVGDWVMIKLHNRYYYNLEVVEVEKTKITVKQYYSHNKYHQHDIYLEYIQKLTIQDLDLTYPVGGPVTAILILFFLLV